MAKKKNDFEKQDEQLQEVNEALSGAGKWVEDHSKVITWVLGIIVVGVLGYLGFLHFYKYPKQQAATEAMYELEKNVPASVLNDSTLTDEEKMRRLDSLMVYGDAMTGVSGYLDIADDCPYQQGELAALNAGIHQYNMGQYAEALENIQRFSADDININTAALLLQGDCYVELTQYDDAIAAYEKVAETGHKVFAPHGLYKAGLVYMMKKNDKAAALKAFTTIKEEYPASLEASSIDKYIAIVK